jgi:hypothetical protein
MLERDGSFFVAPYRAIRPYNAAMGGVGVLNLDFGTNLNIDAKIAFYFETQTKKLIEDILLNH